MTARKSSLDALTATERTRRYRERHAALGLCQYCDQPTWEGLTTCYEHTMAGRKLKNGERFPQGRPRKIDAAVGASR